MKIAVLLPSLSGGGSQRSVMRVATYAAEAGHEVELVLLDGSTMRHTDELSTKIRVVDLGIARRRLPRGIPAFRRYLREAMPDAILTAQPVSNSIAAIARRMSGQRARLVISERVAQSPSPERRMALWTRLANKLVRLIVHRSYRLADAIIAVSAGLAEQVRTIPGIKPERVHVVYNPSWNPQIESHSAEPSDHPWLRQKGPPVVLSAGRLTGQKDFGTLIRAFARLAKSRDTRLIILGEGEARSDLEALVRQFGLEDRISIPGFVELPYASMAKASVFVMSSSREGFGNVLVEAMACGTPVVSTDCPSGPSEILEGGRYGPLVPVGDVEALADAIAATLDNPLPADMLKARAREFSIEKAAEAYLRLLLPAEHGAPVKRHSETAA